MTILLSTVTAAFCMKTVNHNGPIARVVITTVGGLIGGLFGEFLFVPAGFFDRPPTSADIAWAIVGFAVSVTVGAAIFSWAGRTGPNRDDQ